MSSKSDSSQCPLCFESFPRSVLERHASQCTGETPKKAFHSLKRATSKSTSPFSASKKIRRQNVDGEAIQPKASPPSTSNGGGGGSGKIPTATATSTASHPLMPLAEQLRPRCLGELLGQEGVTGPKSIWKNLLDQDRIPSMILWGPPGCGKTSLANVIHQKCKVNPLSKFVKLSAVTSGVSDVKEVVKVAQNDMKMFKKATILFIDEVHR